MGDPRAVHRLARAADLARDCQMSALARRAAGLIAARGDDEETHRDEQPLTMLSERELEVVRLVIEGLTNRQIAEVLTISHRTVQAHIASALRKTGARGRTELATLAIRQRG